MKNNNESITKKILNYLRETSLDFCDLSMKIIFEPRTLLKGTSLYRNYPLYPFSKKILNLKRSPYFKFKNNRFFLTEAGRIKIIKSIIKNKKIRKWDRKWRIIIFDIPELNRRQRSLLRKELKFIGFKELQKSIWVIPYDIEKELMALLKLWKIDFKGDIRFLRVEKIAEDKDLIKHFKLK